MYRLLSSFFLYKTAAIEYTSFSVGKYENIDARQICAPLYDRLGAAQSGWIYPVKRYFGAAGYFNKISRTNHLSFEQIRTFAKRARTARRIQTCAAAKSIHRRRNTAHHRRRFGAGEMFGNRNERVRQTVNMCDSQIVGGSWENDQFVSRRHNPRAVIAAPEPID